MADVTSLRTFISCLILFTALQQCQCFLQQGIWDFKYNKDNIINAVTKSLYKESDFIVHVDCEDQSDAILKVKWTIQETKCAGIYEQIIDDKNILTTLLNGETSTSMIINSYLNGEMTEKCSDINTLEKKDWVTLTAAPVAPTEKVKENTNITTAQKNATRLKREASKEASKETSTTTVATTTTTAAVAKKEGAKDPNCIATTESDGIFIFILQITSEQNTEVNVTVKIKGPHGYLSAIDYPLLPFYGVMCVVYAIFGIIWLVLSLCNWKDMLRVQFWIIGVIFLGMLEKAVFFAEHETVNKTGISVQGAIIFAEVVSCAKRTIARMLVVIVSLGFGIVKPRLGAAFHRLLIIGALYFIFSVIESCMRATKVRIDQSNNQLLAVIPLALIDAAICWWVFTSLVQVTRTLRLRRNVIKLNLYRHFTNTLIFAVLASIIYMAWSVKQHKFTDCLSDWKELWLDDAYWHLLFSVILFVILILWRPTNNNQRYAYSPLVDVAEGEEDEAVMNDAFDGMKNRTRNQVNDSPKKDKASKAEDDLKWIDENIPSSLADTALPSLLDSDEEVMTAKFELSKME